MVYRKCKIKHTEKILAGRKEEAELLLYQRKNPFLAKKEKENGGQNRSNNDHV